MTISTSIIPSLTMAISKTSIITSLTTFWDFLNRIISLTENFVIRDLSVVRRIDGKVNEGYGKQFPIREDLEALEVQ